MDIFSYIQLNGEADDISVPNPPTPQQNKVHITASTNPTPPQHFDVKILAELRPEDAFFLQKTRNATLVPTYAIKGKKERVIGAPLSIPGPTTRDFVKALASGDVDGSFPKDSFNRAIEVIY